MGRRSRQHRIRVAEDLLLKVTVLGVLLMAVGGVIAVAFADDSPSTASTPRTASVSDARPVRRPPTTTTTTSTAPSTSTTTAALPVTGPTAADIAAFTAAVNAAKARTDAAIAALFGHASPAGSANRAASAPVADPAPPVTTTSLPTTTTTAPPTTTTVSSTTTSTTLGTTTTTRRNGKS